MKRKQRPAFRTKHVVLSITVCTFLCLAGIGYVWAKSQLSTLGREMKAMETKLDELRRRNAGLVQKYAEMCNPRELDLAVRRLNTGLSQPRPDQIVRLAEPPAPGREEKRYAAVQNSGQ